ncbi:T9SS type A sorting domain-containing protein [Hymenobacter canadensis]|uniref:T9SS type A sorting domain-containing protein n=1 Tax=Hymenobacter canadensis TaxID=2999067 RepID=A0ABY7LRW9_9BACT|nr:T9SS type A sorting domain-containing protein [Hymenobacter canadensis]WBA41475.1 T9SS type A sorting domain-containing protein [Hymenobacter canadensis]
MQHPYPLAAHAAPARPATVAAYLLLLLTLLLPWTARAQAPAWSAATIGSSSQANGTSTTQATAVDAAGNVFVTGNFTGQVAFGSTLLSSAGGNDLFVAKYVPATATWAWAQSGGGTGTDFGQGLAVSGISVYVTGYITNNTANSTGVLFGGTGTTAGTVQVNGASATSSQDLVVAKYTDNGATATLGWTQVGGGTSGDIGFGLAVSGTSVYVTGVIVNTTANASGVLFGGTGTTAGTVQVNGATATNSFDLVVAKYIDNGATATLGWTQVGGGTDNDQGNGIAVRGTSVYVAGSVVPSATFGSFTINNPVGTTTNFLGELLDAVPLPVALTEFAAAPEGPQAVRLRWATASEVNSAAFEVERSPNGRTFGAIGTVPAAGSSSGPRRYALLDPNPPAHQAILYYRLRQLDADGTFSYSPVRVVARAAALSLYPNPTIGAAMLTGAAPGAAVQVLDALGRLVLRATADATGTARLVLSAGQLAGLYLVRCGAQVLRLVRE